MKHCSTGLAVWKAWRLTFSRLVKLRYLNRIFAIVALAGLLASMTVHIAAFVGVNFGFRLLMWLWLPIPILVLPLAIAHYAPDFQSVARVQSEFLAAFYASIPKWAKHGIFGLFFYFIINFTIFLVMTGNGFPERMQDGSIAVMNHGAFVRGSDERELHRAELMRERFFSSGGAVCYFYLMAYYGLRRDSRSEDEILGSN